ncbi:MAG TPA: DUF924 family protein [Burkholderiales bacterium]|jgi:uncharacterized protein (DUF924 family)|nr:DUF924 family protein [Burkholderiales bacterium]
MTQEILRFWFGSNADDAAAAAEKSRLWWSKDSAVDAQIRERFQDLVEAAGRGELTHWAATAHGRLALILLTDQFPRNIYRGTPRAFAFDPVARLQCQEGIAVGDDRTLRLIERVFFYLPLEHSESAEDQAQSVGLFSELANRAPAAQRALFDGFLDYAVRHRDIIERFGRFPHRNAILGRPSTPEEIAFLRTPGSSF